jgi:hypothetical protein
MCLRHNIIFWRERRVGQTVVAARLIAYPYVFSAVWQQDEGSLADVALAVRTHRPAVSLLVRLKEFLRSVAEMQHISGGFSPVSVFSPVIFWR